MSQSLILKLIPAIFLVLLWVPGGYLGQTGPDRPLSEQVRERLRNRIEAGEALGALTVGGELIHASVVLPRFYERRTYRPAWTDNDGPLPQVDDLIRAIRGARREGLRPADYHLGKIETALAEIRQDQRANRALDPGRLTDLEVLLTDAFLIYASHLLAGRVNPETIDSEWIANRRGEDLASVLENALTTGEVEQVLAGLLPPQSGYAKLREALARYRDIAARGGWPEVPDGPKLQRGDRSERVVALRARLMEEGDLVGGAGADREAFDDTVEEAVRRFQVRHGLDVDGVVGRATLAQLNVPAPDRVRQIELNMERWRWLPQDLGERFILLNIANFELDVVEGGLPVLTMRAVVGRTYRRTPVFSTSMTYLVLSPYWNVPPNIAVKDILPTVKKDPDYLARLNIRVFRGWGAEAQEIDPGTINWSLLGPGNFSYRFRQDPGPVNALGRVKFMFPNRFNVYLHDTPARELFAKNVRTFSSGCIRIEKPIELAEYVLQGSTRWTREVILSESAKGVEQTVRIPRPIPVHLLYWTAWSEQDGTTHFRPDIYGRDARLAPALREEPPTAG